ncbi:MAG TPA: hypothetical protein VKV32_17235 [Stellaceae bacterium]|nr:hypothetical protein [Stellaceae bacterium]
MTAFRAALLVSAMALIAGPLAGRAAPARDNGPTGEVLTYHADAARSGDFVIPNLTAQRARALHPDPGFHAEIAGHVYAQPLFWHPAGGGAGLVLVPTEDDTVYALDGATGKTVWKQVLGQPVPRSALPCGNIDPLGITGTPAIDPRDGAIYLDAMTMKSGAAAHEIFGLSLRDGSVLPGWPVDVGTAVSGFTARNQNQRAALALLGDSVYVGFGGHFGDCASYHGWVVGAKLVAPHQVTSWHTPAQPGAVWAPGGIASDGRSLYIATGNTMGARQWSGGEAVIRLPPDLQFSDGTKDYFAPGNWREMDERDADLGGVAPALIDVPGAAPLVLALGKDGKAYLLDRNNLGGIGHALAEREVSPRAIRTATASYTVGEAVYVAFEGPGSDCPAGSSGRGLTVLKITASPPAIATAWCGAVDGRGAPIVTTTDGKSDPIVWMLGAEGDDRLYGFAGDSGQKLVETAPMRGLRHFQTLIATPDRLYVAGDSAVYAFAF